MHYPSLVVPSMARNNGEVPTERELLMLFWLNRQNAHPENHVKNQSSQTSL